jgi:hydrogenase expression/formation protein HypD
MVQAPVSLMEVCGTHTMSIGRSGLRTRLPADLRLLSGPGCPVCVTPCVQIDEIIAMAREPGVTIATFGDMMRVRGSRSSLQAERTRGGDVRVVYSAKEALEIARSEPRRIVVFLGIGFETTSPTVASTLVQASSREIDNFRVLPAFKLVPPAMDALVDTGEARLDGFICPGHVSTIIGSTPYEHVASGHGIPCVVTGFDALDILEGIAMLLQQKAERRAEVEIQYSHAVPRQGNPTAIALMDRVFDTTDARWRGIGTIPASGLVLSEEFSRFDARSSVPVEVDDGPDLPEGCSCGEVMRGVLRPEECRLFGRACTPANPVGPCMVSCEGSCAIHFRFGG